MPNKKRKVTSPLVESRSPKVSKVSKKDCFDQNIPEEEVENATEKDNSVKCIVITDDKKELEQNSRQDANKKHDVTSKRSAKDSVRKTKKLDKSQQKSGALTKFLKRTDRTRNIADDGTRQQDTSVQEEKDEVCLDESMESLDRSKSEVFEAEKKSESSSVRDKNAKSSLFHQSDREITILSSDDEMPSMLNQSTSSINEETKSPATFVTSTSDKDAKNKSKLLTPKQLEKRRETTRRKEEKLKLKMVCVTLKITLHLVRKI